MLGAIADDFTGATDLATMLRRSGHRVAVVIEDGALPAGDGGAVDAVVVALKTRTAPVAEAVRASIGALGRLRAWGADRCYLKYCSTFDSTDTGNIGPVLDALADALDAERVVVVPSLPANGRTVYHGHLFVGPDLLENSSMRKHPLTPMTRSRVAELLRPQTAHEVAEVPWETVRLGGEALRSALAGTSARYAVVDAIEDADLLAIGAATADDVLVSGGSGLALGIPGPRRGGAPWVAPPPGRGAVLCGSVSRTSLAQVAHAALDRPVRRIDLDAALADPGAEAAAIADWVLTRPPDTAPVVCAARERADVRAEVGGTPGAVLVEAVLADVAARLVSSGQVTALVVAGGETSGAVVRALGVGVLHIGPELAPGVCWATADAHGRGIAIALKSGNFGGTDLFTRAWEALR
ncbi:3-oxo-tetronate kinase [Allonocardiopsis opalescens]|uniref:3-oxo-tetronate kinase n=1 Tax=Allonocardiopsis opalescens TaxID=1144618 RepID=A0A2T0PYJ7_9ACTN|nr:3-oxo-tetronate kinase [Allonocardiopsis opalescens]PRX96588.1 uncharacterized protein YgbK (DUF1537 family) [Allonocardiopsis opalescens]